MRPGFADRAAQAHLRGAVSERHLMVRAGVGNRLLPRFSPPPSSIRTANAPLRADRLHDRPFRPRPACPPGRTARACSARGSCVLASGSNAAARELFETPSSSIFASRCALQRASSSAPFSGTRRFRRRMRPCPGALPVRSMAQSPSCGLTTRISSVLGFISRQPTHMRMGILRFFSILFLFPCALIIPGGSGLALGFLGRDLGLDLALALDVDLPAGQLGGEAGVLAFLADGQRQLVVRHDDARGLLRFGDVNADDPRAGLSALAMYSAGSFDHLMMSIFSVFSSLTTFSTRMPRGPTHEPTASIIGSVEHTAIFVRKPASRAMDLDLHHAGQTISGTSSSNRRLTRPGCVRETKTCGPWPERADLQHVDLDAVVGRSAPRSASAALGSSTPSVRPSSTKTRLSSTRCTMRGQDFVFLLAVLLVNHAALGLAQIAARPPAWRSAPRCGRSSWA